MRHSARIKAAVEAGDVDAIRNEYQDWLTEEMDKRAALKAERDEALRQRDEAIAAAQFNSCRVEDLTLALDELRTILEPWLDRGGLAWYQEDCCQFCGAISGTLRHEPECPVLRRATLLGPERAPAHPEGDAT